MSEEKVNQCEGCIYLIVGERKDRRGYVLTTSACLCEEKMAAGCIPTYEFSDIDIYKGKMKTVNGFIVFKHRKKLRDNVRLSETGKILADKRLMKAIKKARTQGSKSSPYVPLT